jgi:hypothetical protein
MLIAFIFPLYASENTGVRGVGGAGKTGACGYLADYYLSCNGVGQV